MVPHFTLWAGSLQRRPSGETLAGMTRAAIAYYLLRVAAVLGALGVLVAFVDLALGGALIATAVLCLLIRLALTVEPAAADGRCQQCRTRPATRDEFCSDECAEDYAAHSAGW